MHKPILLIMIILVVLALLGGLFFVYETRFLVGRANIITSQLSVENSYLFVSPLQAKVGGQEKIRVTVFLLSGQGLGLAGKQVDLGLDPDLKVETVQASSDNYGKTVFDVSSTKPGEYYLTVKADGQTLPQKAHLSFN